MGVSPVPFFRWLFVVFVIFRSIGGSLDRPWNLIVGELFDHLDTSCSHMSVLKGITKGPITVTTAYLSIPRHGL
jgi:hypothetical protein